MAESKESKIQERQKRIDRIEYANNFKMTNSEKAKMEIFATCLENLEDSINNNSDSSQKLANKVFWLNVILTIATVIATIIAVMGYFKSP
ncbi:MAG: hypothetical protein ABIC04_07870 [Nanoarchaeota archaeon]